MTIAMLAVGLWVSSRIEQGVLQTSADAAADYVEAFIEPLGDEIARAPPLSDEARAAIETVFASAALADQVVSYKIWRPDGLVLMASNPEIIGVRFEETAQLKRAWTGEVAPVFEDLNDAEDVEEAALGIPLLEVYNPLHGHQTGEVIAVVEFYQNGTLLDAELTEARRRSWLVVGGAFAGSALMLFGIVQAGGRTIDRQRRMLVAQLSESREMSAQNARLKRRVVAAAARATAQAERAQRQIGADLHDGPGQHLAHAALRLDALVPGTSRAGDDARAVRASLHQALAEIRALSRGLAIPDLDAIDMASAIERAVHEHRTKTGMDVALVGTPPRDGGFDYTRKLCAYRFLQETLSNAARHSGREQATVRVTTGPGTLAISVCDEGVGFDLATALRLRDDGGQGLLGLVDRAESLGGSVNIDSVIGKGTVVTLTVPMEETQP